MINDKVYYLSKMPLLFEMSFIELSELAEDFYWEEYPEDSLIVSQGQKSDRFYLLTEGRAEALIDKGGRGHLLVSSFAPGDVFGEISLLTGEPAPTTVRCSEKCVVLVTDAEHFARMLIQWPKLYERFIQNLSQRLNQVNTGLWEARHKEFLRSGLQLNQLQYKFYGLWGSPRTTREVESTLIQLSQSQKHLFIIGERGTGRQMFAWFLHQHQFTESAPFIVVDGHHFDQQWGDLAFETHKGDDGQGHTISSSGLLGLAEGGTLFIRGINLLSPRAQLKLAEIIESGDIRCRIVAGLKAEPETLAPHIIPQLRKCFGERYKLLPLRERKRDIPFIAQGILNKLALQNNRPTAPTLSKEATKLLLSHHYRQGNVTELIQVIERAFFLAENNTIGLEHVFFGPTAEKTGWNVDLLSRKHIFELIQKGIFPPVIQQISTVIFLAIILLLVLVPQTQMAAFLFLLVWGFWWPSLTIFSPLFGRVWCGICPFSFIMEQVQKVFHLNRPVPDILMKYDYLFITFLFLMVFWVEAVTHMRSNKLYTVLWLVSVVAAASVVGILFQRHAWCRHLCPLGGFVGMASVGGMLEVRSDATVCLNKCTTYECYRGTGNLSGCPMSQYVPFVDNNIDCKLCLRCVRNCPNGAVKLNLRIPAREVWHLIRVNQGFTLFIGVSLAILLPILYFEPLHGTWPSEKWTLWFSLTFWATALAAGIITWLIVRPFKTKKASRRVKLTFALIPTVLAGYIIYQLNFIPWIDSIIFNIVLNHPGVYRSLNTSLLTVSKAAAAVIGLGITLFTIVMVLVRRNQAPPGS